MPKIEIFPRASLIPHHSWQCDIHHGPGHHGTGASQAEALFNAAAAWRRHEERHGRQEEA